MKAIASAPGPILCVMGTRPNFMRMAPLSRAFRLRRELHRAVLAHAGEHYDFSLNNRLFIDLGLPTPDVSLEVGSGSHASQTTEAMKRLEPALDGFAPSCAVAVSDVNSTLACSLVAVTVNKGVPGDICADERWHGPSPWLGSRHPFRANFALHGDGSPSPISGREGRAERGAMPPEPSMAASRKTIPSRRLRPVLACNLGHRFVGIEKGRAA